MGTDIYASTNPSLALAIKYLYEWGVGLGGVAVFISLIIAGFEYITSIGDPTKMKEAFNRIRDAVIGLVVLLSSYAILSLIGINLTNLKIDMFQGEFSSPSANCKTTAGADAPDCCQPVSGGAATPGCDPSYFTCIGYVAGPPEVKGTCVPKTSKQECGSANIYYEGGGAPFTINDFGVEHVIDPNKRIRSVIFKDNRNPADICYDPTYPITDNPTVSDPSNPACNCDLQLFTKSTNVTGGNISNTCANGDVYAAPNNDSLKIYNDAKEVVCVSLIKS